MTANDPLGLLDENGLIAVEDFVRAIRAVPTEVMRAFDRFILDQHPFDVPGWTLAISADCPDPCPSPFGVPALRGRMDDGRWALAQMVAP